MGLSPIEPVWDVAVVGAGPAGAGAALSALHSEPHARVLLLDRCDFPRDKSCGDGIAPHVLDVLASIGVIGIEAGYAGVDRLRIGFASGPATDGVMARAAYVIPREVFDARLVQEAVQRGAQFRRHRVRTVSRQGELVVLDGSIRARVVLAADGASSVLRRHFAPRPIRTSTWPPGSPLSWWFTSKPPGSGGAPWWFTSKPPGLGGSAGKRGQGHTAVAIRGYAPVPAGRAAEQVIVFADPEGAGGATWPAYAWSFPIGDGRANIGYGELLRPGRPLTREHLLRRLEDLLPGAALGAQAWHAHLLPLSTGRPRQPDGAILLVGDAMNLINPVTGEGIFCAVTSGVLAGRAAVTAADPGRRMALTAADPGHGYRVLLRSALGVHLRHTDVATLLARSPVVVAAAVRAAARNPDTFDDLVELGLGAGKLSPQALGRITAALIR